MIMIRTFIVEDELPAMQRLKNLVESHIQLLLAGSANKGKEALQQIEQLKPQLIFLDIHLPDISGLDILKVLSYQPLVIFTTAYDRYAVQAFEHDAVDFLLKPFSKERFEQAVEKALLKRNSFDAVFGEQLKNLFARLPARMDYLTRIPAKIGDKIYILKSDEIVFFKSEDKVVTAHLDSEYFIVNYTLDELQARLNPQQFIRIHRSTIANLNFVQTIEPLLGGIYVMKMNDKKRSELNVSRNAAKTVREKLGW